MKSFYITTTLPYVNAEPHIGHALEFVQADTVARHLRLMGNPVFFSTGTDEHGQKVYEAARKNNEDVQGYADRHAVSVQKLKQTLNLSYDAFIRTTSESHKRAAQELWRRCFSEGDIYKKKYQGLYCVGCEKFVTEKDLVDGYCPHHPDKAPEMVEEENYFFALSKYERGLFDYLSREQVIVPEHRLEEARQFVADGVEDFSISREKKRMPWGVPVPDDENQVMYVWFDALTNYISTLGWPEDSEEKFQQFWVHGETLQMAGKDQVRFQSVMWQAMLMSAGIKPTDRIFYHGFITSGGQKMSKSLGNVMSPHDMVKKYGTDAARYLLLRHVHPVEDTDVTWERMDEWYTAGLVNGLGNLVARVMKLAEEHIKNPATFSHEYKELPHGHIDTFSFNEVMDHLWALIANTDLHMTVTEPYKEVKTNPDKARADIMRALEDLWNIALWLMPFMPETSEKIKNAIKENKKPENLFPRL